MPQCQLLRAPKPRGKRKSAAKSRPDLAGRFSSALEQIGFDESARPAIAVSGGGDSVALMHLLAGWAKRKQSVAPVVLTVDHGLRPDSREDAGKVAAWAQAQGLPAHILRWRGTKPQTSIEAKARAARYRLLGEWCVAREIGYLFVAHTLEDQAETFLLRLGRGSGVDGLSGMQLRAPFPAPGLGKIELLRPLLDFRRAELRAYLAARGAEWLDDPMNQDERFARARIRKLLPVLDAAGLPSARIADAARHLARAREALDLATERFLADHTRCWRAGVGGSDFVIVDSAGLAKIPRELGLRALSALLTNFAGAAYRPRFERLQGLFDAILGGDFVARTLAGCRIGRAPKAYAIFGPESLIIRGEAPRTLATKAAYPDGARENSGGILLPDKARLG